MESSVRSAADFEREVAGLRARRDAAGIARGLAAHSSHAGVAAKGCEALFHLTQSEGAADHMLAIARHGGIEALLAARAHHPDVAVVQQDALGALGNLAKDADNKVAIARHGGIEAVLAARARHPDHAEVQARALATLQNLANDDDKARPLLEEALREVGDTLAAVNTREKGIFVGSAVSPPAPTSCGPPRRALSRCRAAARLRSACHPAPAGERRCGTSSMATAFASGTKATPVGARSMLANL